VTATELVLAAQALASAAMCGLIWFVQVVHYPLFGHVGGAEGRDYSAEHQRRTSLVVIPPMLVEGLTAGILALKPPAGIPPALAWAGFALVIGLWWSTGAVQMPLHGRLGREGHAPEAVAALVRSNWVRTILWSARAVLTIWMLRAAA
jgi:hypothetical protein